MKHPIVILVRTCFVLALLFGLVSVSLAQDESLNAVAPLEDAAGNVVGNVSFTQSGSLVWVVAQVNAVPPGVHGLQIHSVGQCDGSAAFSSAGASLGADLPVLFVLQNGTGYLTTITDAFTVASLLDDDGSAVVLHANADNYGNIPERYGVTADEQTLTTGDAGDGIACGVVHTLSSDTATQANLNAIASLPLDSLPAAVSRGEGAEQGTLVMTIPALGGAQIVGQVVSGAAGQIGSVSRDGDTLVFSFTEITYNVSPMELPGGVTIGAQTIALDPSVPSTLSVDLNTGEISRDFHWILTASDVLYNGGPSITLGDTARAQVAGVTDMGGNVYALRLLTHWRSTITLDSWTIAGQTLPSGEMQATAEFDGTYMLDFN